MIADSPNFINALKFTLAWEGGYSNDPHDTGGATNFGVTWQTYNTYRRAKKLPQQHVKNITIDEVREIYFSMYWLPAGCNLLPPKLAICHFDWAVNHGVGGANKLLQEIVETQADGIIGPKTKAAITAALQAHSDKYLCAEYCARRERLYRRWGVGSQARFLKGWLNRLEALKKEIA